MGYFQVAESGRIRFNEHASVIVRPYQIVSIAIELSIPSAKLYTPESPFREQAQGLGDDAILAKLRCDIRGMAGQPSTLFPHFVEHVGFFILQPPSLAGCYTKRHAVAECESGSAYTHCPTVKAGYGARLSTFRSGPIPPALSVAAVPAAPTCALYNRVNYL